MCLRDAPSPRKDLENSVETRVLESGVETNEKTSCASLYQRLMRGLLFFLDSATRSKKHVHLERYQVRPYVNRQLERPLTR